MMNTTAWSGGTDEEYETQHFGFGSQRLKLSIHQMVEEKISAGIQVLETHLGEALDLNDTDKATLTRACEKLSRLYCDRAGPCLDVIDGEIDRILKVPSNAVLPEDEVQAEQVTDEELKHLQDEVENLRKRVERGALMEALLTVEEDELQTIETVCETAKKDMEVLDLLHKKTDKSEGLKSILNETDLLLASVPFLKKDDLVFDEQHECY